MTCTLSSLVRHTAAARQLFDHQDSVNASHPTNVMVAPSHPFRITYSTSYMPSTLPSGFAGNWRLVQRDAIVSWRSPIPDCFVAGRGCLATLCFYGCPSKGRAHRAAGIHAWAIESPCTVLFM